jgi:threonine synthase
LSCIGCGARYNPGEAVYTCRRCGDLLEARLDLDEVGEAAHRWRERPLGVWRYREVIPAAHQVRVSLQEGGTRLHWASRLGEELGLRNLYVKCEGDNPTASFKDRGLTVAVTKAVELGFRSVACASTGNTAASLAAYAAKAGLKCTVLVPQGRVATGKLAQAVVYGATILEVAGNFDQALSLVMEVSARGLVYLCNSVNPFRIEGQKTLAYELRDQLGRLPDVLALPVGNAGNIAAAWKGVEELRALGLVEEVPRMVGAQSQGAAPIVEAVRHGRMWIRPVDRPETVATAIRIGRPISWRKALNAIYSSKGTAVSVSDEEILWAQRLIARREGLFVEPASAAPVAALRRLREEGYLDPEELVVVVATGHGLKDPEAAALAPERPVRVEATLEAIQAFFS